MLKFSSVKFNFSNCIPNIWELIVVVLSVEYDGSGGKQREVFNFWAAANSSPATNLKQLLLLPEVFLLSVFLYFTFSPQATAAAVRYFYPKICIDINPPPTKLVDIFLSHKMKDSIWILLLRGLKYFHSKIWLLLLSPLGERRGRVLFFHRLGRWICLRQKMSRLRCWSCSLVFSNGWHTASTILQ